MKPEVLIPEASEGGCLRKAWKRGYDDRMDCMGADISVSKRNLTECEARVSSFD
jgi:hypothetical protein